MNFKKLRLAAGYNRRQLAEILGCHKQMIYNIESGRCNMPLKYAHIAAIALNISEKKLVEHVINKRIHKLVGKKNRLDYLCG